MADVNLNMDFSLPVIIETGTMNWTTSPAHGVERRRLERENSESGRATSVVRFTPGSSFDTHTHGGGEEYLVLEGTFSDETGDYGKGMYVRNPPGSSHAPFSKEGCTIMVKLCGMKPVGEPQLAVDISQGEWLGTSAAGHSVKVLFDREDDFVRLEKLDAGATLDPQTLDGGLELFVLEGELMLNGQTYPAETWMRFPVGNVVQLSSPKGAVFWSKRGHLK